MLTIEEGRLDVVVREITVNYRSSKMVVLMMKQSWFRVRESGKLKKEQLLAGRP